MIKQWLDKFRIIRRVCLWGLPFLVLCVRADISSLFIRNFSHREYGASCQNWGMAAGPDSFLYVANNTGLLVFDGNSWQIHETPDQGVAYSVAVYRDTVFTGHANDFGYWIVASDGGRSYRSLLRNSGLPLLRNEVFRTLLTAGGSLWIKGEQVCFRYQDGGLDEWALPAVGASELLADGDTLYLWAAGRGVYRFGDKGFEPLPEFETLKAMRLLFIRRIPEGGYLAVTECDGIFRVSDGGCTLWEPPAARRLRGIPLTALTEAGGCYLAGTQRDGLYVFSSDGSACRRFTLNDQLQDNHIRAVFRQDDSSVWLALDNGISRVFLHAPVVLLEERSKIGKLLDARPDSAGTVLVRTNQGVYRLGLRGGSVPAETGFPVPREDRIRDILASLAPELADTILPFRTVFMESDQVVWGLQDESRIYRLRLSRQADEVESVKEYRPDPGTAGVRFADLAWIDGFVVAFTGSGCWRYDRLSDRFIPYPELEKQLGSFAAGNAVFPSGDGAYWIEAANEAGLFRIKDGAAALQCRLLFDDYNLNVVNREKRIVPLSDSSYLVSAMQGLVLLNTNRLKAAAGEAAGSFRLRRIEYTDDSGTRVVPVTTRKVVLPHSFRHLKIRTSTSVFTDTHSVSYRIKGISPGWSAWQQAGDISFFQLPVGTYDLEIRKYVPAGPFPEIGLQIEVGAPWYDTVWAYLLYLALLWGIGQSGLHYYLRHQRRQEQSLQETTRAAEEQYVQQLKNEMLLTELQNKTNELTLQTSALVRRNQGMQLLLEELEHQKQTLGDRYPNKLYSRMKALIEENLDNQADWVVFENYFNSAHRDFTDRLRAKYPDLTTGDYRICCLLRMNLSTKEIASLLNLSVRSVELRRYRLRKRLALDGEANLVDFLSSF